MRQLKISKSITNRKTASLDKYLQEISKEDRLKILINGDPVVELDYSGLHPRLLYAQEGIEFDLNGDPYSIVTKDENVQKFLKVMLLSMLNSKNFVTAEKACNNWRHDNYNSIFKFLILWSSCPSVFQSRGCLKFAKIPVNHVFF